MPNIDIEEFKYLMSLSKEDAIIEAYVLGIAYGRDKGRDQKTNETLAQKPSQVETTGTM